MTKLTWHVDWIFMILLCVLGILLYLGVPGYSFSAYILFGIAGVLLCYRLLRHLKKRHRSLGKALTLLLSVFLIFGLIAAFFTGILINRAATAVPAAACRYVIVLGAGVNGTVPSLSLRERLNAAYDYLIAVPDSV